MAKISSSKFHTLDEKGYKYGVCEAESGSSVTPLANRRVIQGKSRGTRVRLSKEMSHPTTKRME